MKIKEYEIPEDLAMMVIEHISPACVLLSEGGLGKSYLVQTLVEKYCPKSHVYHSGHITPLAYGQRVESH